MKALTVLNDLAEHIHLRMKSCNRHRHPKDWFETKAHRDYDLWFIERGAVRLETGNAQYNAGAGDIIFFYPDMPYTATTGNEGCQFIYVHFDFGIGNQLRILNDFRLAGIVPRHVAEAEALSFVRAFETYTGEPDKPGIRLYLKGCLTLFVAKLLEASGTGAYRGCFALPDGASLRMSSGSLAALQPVIKYIHAHMHRAIRIEELAGLAGMSEKYFIARFKKALGITPNQYIIQVRMNNARDYLYAGQHSIQEIAGLVGYADPYTFSKAFKKYYDVPPSQFH